jgi:hypothetical protein
LVLTTWLGTGCLADRLVTLTPPPAQVTPINPAEARPMTVMPFGERRGAIAEGGPAGGSNAVGGLYGLRGWPAALLVSEPYPVTVQRALAAALAARGIPVTDAGAGPTVGTPAEGSYVVWATIVDFYGYSNWGAAALLTAHVRVTAADGTYLADKTVSREVKQFGLDTVTPKLEDLLGKVITAWAEAVASDPQLTGPFPAAATDPRR